MAQNGFDYNDDQNSSNSYGQGYDPYSDKKNAVQTWYKTYLGRQGSDDEISGWANNANFGSVQNSIMNSPEAQAYKSKPQDSGAGGFPPPPSDPSQYRSWISGLLGGNSGTQEKFKAIADTLKQYGFTPQVASDGTFRGRVYTPDGQAIDFDMSDWHGGSGGSSWSAGGTQAPVDPNLQSKKDDLYNTLLARSQQGLAVDRNDPAVRAQADAFNAQQDKSRRDFLADFAESAGPYSTGAQLGQARMTAEAVGKNSGAFEAELVGREIQNRRSEIADALHSMQGLLTGDQQVALQRELAQLDDAARRYGIDVNAGLEKDRLGYDIGRSDMDYWLRSQGL